MDLGRWFHLVGARGLTLSRPKSARRYWDSHNPRISPKAQSSPSMMEYRCLTIPRHEEVARVVPEDLLALNFFQVFAPSMLRSLTTARVLWTLSAIATMMTSSPAMASFAMCSILWTSQNAFSSGFSASESQQALMVPESPEPNLPSRGWAARPDPRQQRDYRRRV